MHQPIDQVRFVVIDSELTGLDRERDAVIALSAIRMKGSRILVGETFYRLVDPQRDLERDNIIIHRIRPSELINQPTIDVVLQEFAEFIGDDVVVGHFIQIDWAFVNRDMQNHLGKRLGNYTFDTCRVHQWVDLQNHTMDGTYGYGMAQDVECNLFALANQFDITITEAHHALYDALLAAYIWQRYLVSLKSFGVRRLGDLLPIAGA